MRITEDMIRHPMTDESGKLRPPEVMEAAFQARDLRNEQSAHRATRRSLTVYRWLALIGWTVALVSLSLPRAEAAVLPADSIACETEAAYLKQQETLTELTLVSERGCVFTDRDLLVQVVSGNEVYVESVDIHVWVDPQVLQP